MKFKSFLSLFFSFFFLLNSNITHAEDIFEDNNAISSLIQKNPNIKLIISEYNTGKIIAEKNKDHKVSYKKLINNIALLVLSQQLKEENITLDTTLEINNEELISNYDLSDNITVKDLIFLLSQGDNKTLANDVLNRFNIDLDKAKNIIKNLSLFDTKLESLDINENNYTTARNLTYLNNMIIKNYPQITDITKNPQYTLSNGISVENSIEFIPSDISRTIGIYYDNENTSLITYSGNTKIVITILNIEENKEDFFNDMEDLYSYIFSNYKYILVLPTGTFNINKENITIEDDIYDLFYKDSSPEDLKYFLMNEKILFFQNYDNISYNNGTVYSKYKSNTHNSKLTKIKNTFIQDDNFSKKGVKDKLNIVLDRTQYFASLVLLLYSTIFIVLYIIQKSLKKGEN